ncbi:MAG TPA: nitrophenyl compound nitroreductase subunit ArsF family protein [bacterium]|jgi:hypothetical protein
MKFAFQIILYVILAALPARAEEAVPAVADSVHAQAASNPKVVVYYLYFTPRCETCINMEAFAKEAVETGFAKELQQGTVEWHSYDTGQKEYEHFWNDFKLETKSLIIVRLEDGKQAHWKNCEKIWELVGAKPDYLTYVQNEVRAYLNAK